VGGERKSGVQRKTGKSLCGGSRGEIGGILRGTRVLSAVNIKEALCKIEMPFMVPVFREKSGVPTSQ